MVTGPLQSIAATAALMLLLLLLLPLLQLCAVRRQHVTRLARYFRLPHLQQLTKHGRVEKRGWV